MIVFKGGGRTAGGARSGLGKGFRGVLAYLESGSRQQPDADRVAWISFRNLAGVDDPAEAAKVMRAMAAENERVARPVYHFGLSLQPGEHLDRPRWEDAIDKVLRRMGLADHQAVLVSHRDSGHEHVHIVVNRVGPTVAAWSIHDDVVKAREVVRQVERDLSLSRTGPRDLPAHELTSGAYQEALRTGRQPLSDRVRESAAGTFAAATSWRDLEDRLAQAGFRLQAASRGSGLLVTDGHHTASLSRVDRSLSGPRLAERFGSTFREHRLQVPDPPALRQATTAPADTIEARAAELIRRLTETQATFSEADLRRAAFHQPESASLVRAALRSDQVLELGQGAGGATRFTTRDYLEAEVRLLSAASSLAARDDLRLERQAVAWRLGHAEPAPATEQRRAIYHATVKADLGLIVGRAGAGKTTAARTIAAAYEDQGIEVRGAALAGKAAEVLQRETGIPSRTIASLEQAWSEGQDRLAPRSVLVIDEAGMIDARTLGRVLAHAEERGAKVILLGDPDQLKAIGAGDAFRGLLEQHASAQIGTIRRQEEPWQRSASEQLAAGRVAPALNRYEAAGHVHWAGSRAAAQAELVSRYMADRRENPAAARLIVAYRNTEVAELNEALRAQRKAAGEIAAGVKVGRLEISTADRIVFLRNDNLGRDVATIGDGAAVGVKNGSLGTVVDAAPHRIAVRLDDGRQVAFNPARYDAVGHGYAVTVHKAQGTTVDQVYALPDPLMNRNAVYVALTRHRRSVHLFVDRESFPSRQHLDKALSRDARKDLASDYGSAELRRAVERYQEVAAKIQRASRVERPLQEAMRAVEEVKEARHHVMDCRRSVAAAAAQVYRDPRRSLRALLADRGGAEALRRGQAHRYGELRGRGGIFPANRERAAALQAVSSLTGRLDAHQRSVAALYGAKHQVRELAAGISIQPRSVVRGIQMAGGQTLRRLAPSPATIHRELLRVQSMIRAYRHAAHGAQDAIEVAVRGIGRLGVNSALLLLPAKVNIPLGIAIRAVERVVSRGIDLGLGR